MIKYLFFKQYFISYYIFYYYYSIGGNIRKKYFAACRAIRRCSTCCQNSDIEWETVNETLEPEELERFQLLVDAFYEQMKHVRDIVLKDAGEKFRRRHNTDGQEQLFIPRSNIDRPTENTHIRSTQSSTTVSVGRRQPGTSGGRSRQPSGMTGRDMPPQRLMSNVSSEYASALENFEPSSRIVSRDERQEEVLVEDVQGEARAQAPSPQSREQASSPQSGEQAASLGEGDISSYDSFFHTPGGGLMAQALSSSGGSGNTGEQAYQPYQGHHSENIPVPAALKIDLARHRRKSSPLLGDSPPSSGGYFSRLMRDLS